MAKAEEAPKIIFSMLGVSKKIERKEILRDNGAFDAFSPTARPLTHTSFPVD